MPEPDHSAALGLLARLEPAVRSGDRALLCELVGSLVEIAPPMGPQWQALARIAAGIGEVGLSRRALDIFVDQAGGAPAARYQQAAILTESGAWSDAFAILDLLPRSVPDAAGNTYSRGASLMMLGRIDEARAALEEVVALRPQSAQAWLGLAMCTDLGTDPALAARIEAAAPAVRFLSPAQAAPFHYALGKVHADRGEHDRAFAAFTQGAALRRKVTPYDPAADAAEAEEAVAGYSAQGIARLAARQGPDTGRTLFVTGLPRSGSTLVEQVLAAHSQVGHGGEIARLDLLLREVGGRSAAALERYVASQGTTDAARLWDHWLADLFPGPLRVVDKTLGNSRQLGLAAALLPDAPLVWIVRDPLDCAWSCLRTYFTGELAWSWDLADIAAHMRLERRLLQRWQDLLGERLLVLRYEDLVTEPERWIARLLDHCGLPQEAGPFAPEKNRRAVSTASAVQVRRPIGRGAIGSAEPYRRYLEPALGDLLECCC